MKTVAIIVAAGQGKRMGKPKQFLSLAGQPMLVWTVQAFEKARLIDVMFLVVAKNQLAKAKNIKTKKPMIIVEGGEERADSVRNGLSALPPGANIVVIHDGARPAITPAIIDQSVQAAKKSGAVVVGVPVKDTIKKCHNQKTIAQTVDRQDLWQAQTPQAFQASIIKKAYARPTGKATDDGMLVERLGIPVKMILGSYENFKVTTPEDLIMMAAILKDRRK